MKVEAIQNMKMDTTTLAKLTDEVHAKIKDHIDQADKSGLLSDGINTTTNISNVKRNINESLKQNVEHNMQQKLTADTNQGNVVKVDQCGSFCNVHMQEHAMDKGQPNPCKNKISQENLADTAAKQTAGQVIKDIVKGNEGLKFMSDVSTDTDQSKSMGIGAALVCLVCCCCCCCCCLLPLIGFGIMQATKGSDVGDITSDIGDINTDIGDINTDIGDS